MNKEEKLKLLEKLVKEGHITLEEAFELGVAEKEYIYVPYNQLVPQWIPYPSYPNYNPIIYTSGYLNTDL